MLTPEQRSKIEREQSSWIRTHIKGPKANPPGGVYRVMDDIRHELVERPWYGRQVTGDMVESHTDIHRSVYGTSPATSDTPVTGKDIHGNPIGKEASSHGQPSEIEPPSISR